MKNLRSLILTLLITLAAASADAEIINRVYAVVGEKIITQYELETLNPRRLQLIYRKFQGEQLKEELTKYYLKALDLMLNNYIIEQAAAKEGVRVTNREVTGAVNDIMEKNNVDEKKLEELLAASNQTVEQYKWKIKVDILKARLMGTVFQPKIIITDKDIDEYVSENSESLELSDMYELRIMTLGSDAELKEAMADYGANKSFRETAMRFSKAGNASDGGYLGWVELAFLDEEIQRALAGIKEGITKPLKDDEGYRVFYVEGFKNKNELPEDKRDNIVKVLTERRSKEIFDNWLAEKRKEILIQKKYEN